jgi:hypothetical protein
MLNNTPYGRPLPTILPPGILTFIDPAVSIAGFIRTVGLHRFPATGFRTLAIVNCITLRFSSGYLMASII